MISSNIYANFLICGLFLVLSNRRGRGLLGNIRDMLFVSGTMWCIHLSGSRFGILAGIVVITYYLYRLLGRKMILIVALGLIAVISFTPILDNAKNRFSREGTGNRIEKTILGLELLGENYSHALIGVPARIAAIAKTSDGVRLSDNSYIDLLTNYGVIAGSIFLLFLWAVIMTFIKIKGWSLLFILYLTGLFLVTNAVLWDIFIVYSCATLFLLDMNRTSKIWEYRNPEAMNSAVSKVAAEAG